MPDQDPRYANRWHNHDGRYAKKRAFDEHDHDADYVAQGDFDDFESTVTNSFIANANAHSGFTNRLNALELGRGSNRIGTSISTTSDSPVNVATLSFPIGATQAWEATYLIRCGCEEAGGMRIGVDVPDGAHVTQMARLSEGNIVGTWINRMSINSGVLTTSFAASAASGAGLIGGAAELRVIVHTTGTSGNVTFQYQSDTSGDTSWIGAGSMAAVVRLG